MRPKWHVVMGTTAKCLLRATSTENVAQTEWISPTTVLCECLNASFSAEKSTETTATGIINSYVIPLWARVLKCSLHILIALFLPPVRDSSHA